MIFRISGQSGPDGPLVTVPRGCAVRVSVSTLAMPILLSPKSSARTSSTRSGMTGEGRELPGLDTEQSQRGQPALLVWQIEDHAFSGGHRQPGVVEQLAFQLAGFPARVAERDEGLLGSRAHGH